MDWLNIPVMTFSAVAVNHLGLVAAIERTIKHRLPIVNCPKCLTFWTVAGYGTLSGLRDPEDILTVCAAALLAAWAAAWCELAMGYTDRLYLRCYEQIYPTADTPDADASDTGGTVPGVSGGKGSARNKDQAEAQAGG